MSVVVLDPRDRVVHVNAFFEALTGYSLAEMRGRDWATIFGTGSPARGGLPRAQRAQVGETARPSLGPIRTRAGAHREVEWYERTLTNADGECVAWLAIGHDVTDRVAAMRALEQLNTDLESRIAERSRALIEAHRALATHRERLATVVETTTEGMLFFDHDGLFQYASPRAARLLDTRPECLLGRSYLDVLPGGALNGTGQIIARTLAEGGAREWCAPAPLHGQWLAGTAVRTEDGLVVVFRDETDRRVIETQLREREALLREAHRIAQLGSFDVDLATGAIHWSDDARAMLGVEPADVGVRDAALDLVHPDDRQRVEADRRRAIERALPYDCTHRLVLPDGRVKHVRERGEAHVDATGAPYRVIGTLQDVTQEVIAERAMTIKDAAIASSINGIAIASLDGRLTYVNPAFAALYGLDSTDEALGERVDEMWLDSAHAATMFRQLRENGAWCGRLELLRRDGLTRVVEVSAHVVRDESGPRCAMASFSDVTARVAAEQELEHAYETLSRFKQLIDSARQPIGLADMSGCCLYANAAMRNLLALPCEADIRLHSWHELFDGPERPRLEGEVLPALMAGGAWTGELELRTPAGPPRQTIHSAFVVRDRQHRPAAIGTMVTDITERIEAERKLARSEALFRATFEQVALGMALSDLDDVIQHVNAPFAAICGVASEDLVGTSWSTLLAPTDAAALARARRRLLDGELRTHSLQVEVRRVDGATRGVDLTVSALTEHGEPVELLWVAQDVTDRRRAERALQRSEASLQRAERLAKVGSWEWDLRTDELRGSPEMLRQYGLDPDDPPALTVALLERRVHSDDRALLRANIAEARATGVCPTTEYRIVLPSGEVRRLHTEVSVLESPDGAPLSLFGVSQDVTDKRDAEARIAAQLREKEVLLREIHHRVKNNLQVVSSLLYFQGAQSSDPEVTRQFQESRDRVRAMALVHETLYRSVDLGRVDFERYVATLSNALATTYHDSWRQVRFMTEVTAPELDIEEAVACGLITSELVTNALKHAFVGRAEGAIRIALQAPEDGWLRLTVADDGVGMPARGATSDTLGLRLVSALAEQLGAALEMRAEVGVTVNVTFQSARRAGRPP